MPERDQNTSSNAPPTTITARRYSTKLRNSPSNAPLSGDVHAELSVERHPQHGVHNLDVEPKAPHAVFTSYPHALHEVVELARVNGPAATKQARQYLHNKACHSLFSGRTALRGWLFVKNIFVKNISKKHFLCRNIKIKMNKNKYTWQEKKITPVSAEKMVLTKHHTNPVGNAYKISSVSLLSQHHGDHPFVSASFCGTLAPSLQCVTPFGALLNPLDSSRPWRFDFAQCSKAPSVLKYLNHETVNPRDTRKTTDAKTIPEVFQHSQPVLRLFPQAFHGQHLPQQTEWRWQLGRAVGLDC